jgi:O-antigen/teichoic acid export membrane protein
VPADGAPRPPAPGFRRAIVGAACISLQPLILSALMLPVTAYVIRGLGPTAYGEWATATALVGVVTFVTNLGLRGAFIRTVARDPASAETALAEQLGTRGALSGLAAVLALVACLALRYPSVVVACTAVSSLGLVLTAVATSSVDLLQALQRLPTIAGVNMISGLILTAASVAVVSLGGGPVEVAISYLAGPVMSVALLLWIIRRRFFPVRLRWSLGRAARLLWEARHLALMQFVWSVSQHAEAVVIPVLVGPTTFGYFSAGALLANRLTALPEGLSGAAYPAMVSAARAGAPALLRVFLRFLALVLLTCAPAALAVSFLAGPIAELLFPGRSEVCEQVMRITIWLVPVMGVHYVLGYLFNAVHEDAASARAALAGSVGSLVVTAVLVWQFGLVGACWSMVLRYVVHLVTQVPLTVRVFRRLLAHPSAPLSPGVEAPPAGAL